MGKTLQDHRASMELFERASTILNYNVWEMCQNGPQSKLDQTLYSHVALFVNAMAGIEKLRSDVEDFDERVTEAAGFGVGEFCALVLGGVLKFEDGGFLLSIINGLYCSNRSF
jgi:[acyl-carrier-protein] S-malonyltransferase